MKYVLPTFLGINIYRNCKYGGLVEHELEKGYGLKILE